MTRYGALGALPALGVLLLLATATASDDNTFIGHEDSWYFRSPLDWSQGSFPHYPDRTIVTKDLSLVKRSAPSSARELDIDNAELTIGTGRELAIGPTRCFAATQRLVRRATATADTVCESIHAACAANEWETHATTATSQHRCKPHTVCDERTHVETTAAGTHHDRVCAPRGCGSSGNCYVGPAGGLWFEATRVWSPSPRRM